MRASSNLRIIESLCRKYGYGDDSYTLAVIIIRKFEEFRRVDKCKRKNKDRSRRFDYSGNFDLIKAAELILINPTCYYTFEPIDLLDRQSWSLDHYISRNRDGKCTNENMRLSSTKANMLKSDMSHEEALELCEKFLEAEERRKATKALFT